MLGVGVGLGLGLEVDEGISPLVFAVEDTSIVEDKDVGGPFAKRDPGE